MNVDALILDCKLDKVGTCYTEDCLKKLAEKPLNKKNNIITLNFDDKQPVGRLEKLWYKNKKLYAKVILKRLNDFRIIEKYVIATMIKAKQLKKKKKGKRNICIIEDGILLNTSLIERGRRTVKDARMTFSIKKK